MKEYFCTTGNTSCMGYQNGKCITFENCMYKEEKEEIKVNKIRKQTGHDCWGNREYEDFYIVTDNGKVIYESQDDPTELIKHLKH